MSELIKNRYDFSILFDVKDGNPNGDPDRDNMPRMDDYNKLGLVSSECIKRKIRDAVPVLMENNPNKDGYGIYVIPAVSLEQQNNRAYAVHNIDPASLSNKKPPVDISEQVVHAICSTFYDCRTFGCVITGLTKNRLPGGQLKGPVQLDMARSIDEIQPMRIGLTRVTRSTDKEILEDGKLTSMAQRYIVPYGLYRCNGSVSACDAEKYKTGFNMDDLALLWKSIMYMFENDHSAGRGEMTVRELIVFKHDTKTGCARKQDLEGLVEIYHTNPDSQIPPRSFEDYMIGVNEKRLPNGVTCKRFTDPYADINNFVF